MIDGGKAADAGQRRDAEDQADGEQAQADKAAAQLAERQTQGQAQAPKTSARNAVVAAQARRSVVALYCAPPAGLLAPLLVKA